MQGRSFQVIVIGGGHAGAEAAWAAANLLGEPASVALVTIDPAKTGVMSCPILTFHERKAYLLVHLG